jgi:hypothetical protein
MKLLSSDLRASAFDSRLGLAALRVKVTEPLAPMLVSAGSAEAQQARVSRTSDD